MMFQSTSSCEEKFFELPLNGADFSASLEMTSEKNKSPRPQWRGLWHSHLAPTRHKQTGVAKRKNLLVTTNRFFRLFKPQNDGQLLSFYIRLPTCQRQASFPLPILSLTVLHFLFHVLINMERET